MTIEQFKTTIVLAPHTDDGEFGCGGTIARMVEADIDVTYVAFSTAVRSVPPEFPQDILAQEVREATAALGVDEAHLQVHDFEVRTFPTFRQEILEEMIRLNEDLRPDCVLMPSLHDLHQDHTTVAEEGLRAFKRTTVLGYEIPWNNVTFNNQAYVALEPRHVSLKVAALAKYRSQQHRNYASEEYVRNLALTRGINVGRDLAEAFEVYRWIL